MLVRATTYRVGATGPKATLVEFPLFSLLTGRLGEMWCSSGVTPLFYFHSLFQTPNV